jgi:succinate dehydrogenase / fumarate reductase cytochrome b subunit
MKSFLAFCYSSIGKKVLMSLTGLFLIIFLVEHLIGNLLLFANDNGVMYEAYSEFLVSNPIIRLIEIFLFVFIIGHAILGAYLWLTNRIKRPIKYRYFRIRENVPLASRTWFIITTGSIIFLFLIIHLRSFFWPMRVVGEQMSGYDLVIRAFADPWYDAFYLVALLLLGYHLRHGFQSALQTLGLRNKKYTPFLDGLAFIVWFLIPLLYAIIPVYFYYINQAASNVFLGVH